MTAQEIFDKVATHLLTQNAKAWDDAASACAYRDEHGRACAVGCMFTDAQAAELIRLGLNSSWLLDLPEEITTLFTGHLDLVSALQNVHDGYQVSEWPCRLRRVAEDYHLSFPTLLTERLSK